MIQIVISIIVIVCCILLLKQMSNYESIEKNFLDSEFRNNQLHNDLDVATKDFSKLFSINIQVMDKAVSLKEENDLLKNEIAVHKILLAERDALIKKIIKQYEIDPTSLCPDRIVN